MPHGAGSGRRQEKRCWLPNGDIVYVEEGTNCPGISGQQGSGRRRLYWEEQGLITRAPPRPGPTPPPAGPQPGDRPYFPGAGRREDEWYPISQARQGDERGRGLPRSNQERAERHESLFPGTPLPERGTGLSQDYAPVVPTIWGALLAGLGIGVGFAVVNKVVKS